MSTIKKSNSTQNTHSIIESKSLDSSRKLKQFNLPLNKVNSINDSISSNKVSKSNEFHSIRNKSVPYSESKLKIEEDLKRMEEIIKKESSNLTKNETEAQTLVGNFRNSEIKTKPSQKQLFKTDYQHSHTQYPKPTHKACSESFSRLKQGHFNNQLNRHVNSLADFNEELLKPQFEILSEDLMSCILQDELDPSMRSSGEQLQPARIANTLCNSGAVKNMHLNQDFLGVQLVNLASNRRNFGQLLESWGIQLDKECGSDWLCYLRQDEFSLARPILWTVLCTFINFVGAFAMVAMAFENGCMNIRKTNAWQQLFELADESMLYQIVLILLGAYYFSSFYMNQLLMQARLLQSHSNKIELSSAPLMYQQSLFMWTLSGMVKVWAFMVSSLIVVNPSCPSLNLSFLQFLVQALILQSDLFVANLSNQQIKKQSEFHPDVDVDQQFSLTFCDDTQQEPGLWMFIGLFQLLQGLFVVAIPLQGQINLLWKYEVGQQSQKEVVPGEIKSDNVVKKVLDKGLSVDVHAILQPPQKELTMEKISTKSEQERSKENVKEKVEKIKTE